MDTNTLLEIIAAGTTVTAIATVIIAKNTSSDSSNQGSGTGSGPKK